MWYRLQYCVVVGCTALVLALTGCRGGLTTSAEAQAARRSAVRVEQVVGGLREPVALAFLSNTVMLVAERRSGRIRWVEQGVPRAEPFATLPVPTAAEGRNYGLLGLAVDPDYPARPYVYALHTVGSGNQASGQRIVRFTVQNGKGVDLTTVVDHLPVGATDGDNGGRLLFGADGKLYVTVGETQHPPLAQDYTALAGKVLRYNADGSVPADNPFEKPDTATASNPRNDGKDLEGDRTPIYAIGFRNPFGIAQDALNGEIYLTDIGPEHGDKLNRLVAGENYGWPLVVGMTDDPHFRPPLWSSGQTAVVPMGMACYTGTALLSFRGNLFFAGYRDGKLRRVILRDRDHIAAITTVPAADGLARLDVAMGRDGDLYFSSEDAVYRLQGGE